MNSWTAIRCEIVQEKLMHKETMNNMGQMGRISQNRIVRTLWEQLGLQIYYGSEEEREKTTI
jgi:hypothetical protein